MVKLFCKNLSGYCQSHMKQSKQCQETTQLQTNQFPKEWEDPVRKYESIRAQCSRRGLITVRDIARYIDFPLRLYLWQSAYAQYPLQLTHTHMRYELCGFNWTVMITRIALTNDQTEANNKKWSKSFPSSPGRAVSLLSGFLGENTAFVCTHITGFLQWDQPTPFFTLNCNRYSYTTYQPKQLL